VGDLLREEGAPGAVSRIAHAFAAPAGTGAELRSGSGAGLGVGAHLVAMLAAPDRELGEKAPRPAPPRPASCRVRARPERPSQDEQQLRTKFGPSISAQTVLLKP